jgi:hypothetical protein
MKKHNGYRSWNGWNVSLWINNEESLYRTAYELVEQKGLSEAVLILSDMLSGDKTPDGAIYNKISIKNAISDIL